MELYEASEIVVWNKNVNNKKKHEIPMVLNKNMNKFETFAVNFSNLITLFLFLDH